MQTYSSAAEDSQLPPVSFTMAQAVGSLVIIALNFFLNNMLTFRLARLRGRRVFLGLSLFYVACSVGLVFNLAAAKGFRYYGAPWYGVSTIGIVIGSVWNYWVASLLVWNTVRRRTAKIQQAYDLAPLQTASFRKVPELRPKACRASDLVMPLRNGLLYRELRSPGVREEVGGQAALRSASMR